jgi:hypothetical protein
MERNKIKEVIYLSILNGCVIFISETISDGRECFLILGKEDANNLSVKKYVNLFN